MSTPDNGTDPGPRPVYAFTFAYMADGNVQVHPVRAGEHTAPIHLPGPLDLIAAGAQLQAIGQQQLVGGLIHEMQNPRIVPGRIQP